MTLREEFWWPRVFPAAHPSSVATVQRCPMPKRFGRGRVVSKPWYRPDSFWALPPRDVKPGADVRSDRLDDFLYGASA